MGVGLDMFNWLFFFYFTPGHNNGYAKTQEVLASIFTAQCLTLRGPHTKCKSDIQQWVTILIFSPVDSAERGHFFASAHVFPAPLSLLFSLCNLRTCLYCLENDSLLTPQLQQKSTTHTRPGPLSAASTRALAFHPDKRKR